MEITNTKVYGLADSIFASGYPMRKLKPCEPKFEAEVASIETAIAILHYQDVHSEFFPDNDKTNNSHIKRAMKLGDTSKGSGHDQFLTGIHVHFDLDIPTKVWVEAERYHFLDFVSSMSTMHKLKEFDLTLPGSFDRSTDSRMIKIVQELQIRYSQTMDPEDFLTLIMSTPAGLNLCARMVTNYRQLKTICSQRGTHRLPHWRTFVDWVRLHYNFIL